MVEDQEIIVCGTATGPVPYEQTVFRAEAQALPYLVTKTEEGVDVTLVVRECNKMWTGETDLEVGGYRILPGEGAEGSARPALDQLAP